MWQMWAVVLKELQLLRRDRGGLAVLFVMPVALVLIVCLVQDNILKASGAGRIEVVLVDADHGSVAQQLRSRLESQESFRLTVVDSDAGYPLIRRQVAQGDYQIGIYLPDQLSQRLQQQATERLRRQLSGKTADDALPLPLEYFFDPAVQGGLQAGFSGLLQQFVVAESLRQEVAAFQRLLPGHVERHVSEQLGSMFAQVLAQNPLNLTLPDEHQPLIQAARVHEEGSGFIMPTSIQHNVPAWSMFGLFFIILPLSTVLLQERAQGVYPRLQLVPGHAVALMGGRICAYLWLCLIQFSLMLLVGYYLLPQLGTDPLHLQGQLPALYVIALCAGLTACGFGLVLGVYARSEQQASLTAAVAIVIAAALGGIMVPVYLMPPMMQTVSIVSPLGWGLEAFQTILLRQGSLSDTLPQLLQLLACAGCSFVVAWRGLQRQRY